MQLDTTNLQNVPTINVWPGGGGDPAALVNEYSVLSIPAFWSGVRFLSETLASLPKSVYRSDGSARGVVNHPQNKLLNRKANPYTIPFVVFETWFSHAVVHGNGFLIVQRDSNTSAPTAYFNVDPQIVTPFRYDGQQWFSVKGAGRTKDGKVTNLILAAADVLHLPGLGFDGQVGYPVIQLMREAMELARNSQRFASRFLRSGTHLQGSIEIPGTATKEQIDAVLDRINRAHSGIDAGYGFTVLTGGATMKNATIPPEQSQLLESRQFSVVDMCRILRVPPHIVFDLSRATWSNVESMGIEVVKYSLRPWVEKAEQELSSKLLTQKEQDGGYEIRFDVDGLLRGDTATQTSTTLSLVNGGVITANEGRARLDLAPLEDPAASKLRIPVNFPVASTGDSAAPAPKPPTDDTDKKFEANRALVLDSLAPIIADAVQRVETKTTKAFANREGKPQADRTIWANVFAEEQAKFVADAFAPITLTLKAQLNRTIDAEKIGQRYAQAIRAKFAGIEFKPLAVIVQESFEADTNSEGENENQQ